MNLNLKYEAIIETPEQGTAQYTFEESVKTRTAAWLCGFTAIFYGGYCWAYLAYPRTNQSDEIKEDAQRELKERYHITNFEVKSDGVTKADWNENSPKSNLVFQGKKASN